ncbi:hypothetical protein LOTGIDRAFT_235225 [Lottia gigantea]|uniref:Uncharacterized protein n=1 Tax=Lottia gigantea TaxID=225164 RepID=V4A0P8_LOTGI|nr:hypothetical protein LOTGIDRAFT_235225 [Lottia gigantea]ESO86826.1 hypothetical protein LOTGIDRAFT_235225 [Lottia gigantea]
MRSCDPKSWEYLDLLSESALIMIVMGVRPIIIDEPTCPEAQKFFENRQIKTKEVDLMETRHMTPLACQILDVQHIQRELDLYLKMLSHGIPKWTERLIQHMYESKQLLIVEEDHKPSGISTLSPQTDLLNKKPSKERRAANIDRRKHAITFETSLQTSNAEESSGNTSEMLGFLGYVQPKTGTVNLRSSVMTKVKMAQRVAILVEGINTKDLKIPEAMTNMVTARLDSMRAMDQLVVKCCAVINAPFSLDIVKAVLQKSNIFQVSLSMKRLFTNGTFECSEYRRARKLSYLDDSAYSQNLCYCQNQVSADSDHMCKKLSFRNFLLQTMASNVLMATQRHEIHVRVADYLLADVKENRKYLPFYLFSTTSSSPPGNRKASNDEEVKPFLNATDLYEDISRSGNTTDYVQHLKNGFNSERKNMLSALLPVYRRVKEHLYNANEYGRLLYLMVEASAVSLSLENTSHGLLFAEDAESVLEKILQERPDINSTNLLYTTACIHRLSAQALRMSGRSEMGAVHLRKTSSILKLDHPSTRLSYLFKMLKYDKYPTKILQLEEFANITQSDSEADRYILELINCLIEFCHHHKIRGDFRMLHLDLLRLLTVLRATSPHPIQILEACQLLLEFYRLKKRFDISFDLELQLFSMSVYYVESISYHHIEKLVECLKQSISISLDQGMVHKALVSGRTAAAISRLFEDELLMIKTLPTLGMATILDNSLDESRDILTKLKETCLTQNKRKERAWYFNLTMELLLIRGYSIESFPRCLSTLSLYLKDYDVVHGETVARFYSAMCIATWYCRQSEWKHGQRWFDYWDYYQPEQISLLSLLARLKKLECMLLSLWLSLNEDVAISFKRIEPGVIQEIKLFQAALKEIPGIIPRFYHHLAYYYLLKNKRTKAKKYLKSSMKISFEQGNKLDWGWAWSTWKSWHDPDLAESVSEWNKLIQNHDNSFDWTRTTDTYTSNIYYPFPLPPNFIYFNKNTIKL